MDKEFIQKLEGVVCKVYNIVPQSLKGRSKYVTDVNYTWPKTTILYLLAKHYTIPIIDLYEYYGESYTYITNLITRFEVYYSNYTPFRLMVPKVLEELNKTIISDLGLWEE